MRIGAKNTLGVMAITLIGASAAVAESGPESRITLPEVVITGNKIEKQVPRYLSMPKYSESILNTPQSITIVPQKVLVDQRATTMRDSLRNVSGISVTAGEGGAGQGDSMTLRGFGARTDMFLDGMRDFGNYTRDAFNYDRVEVLKGPSSTAFGRGSTGGVINQVSKTPEKRNFVSGDMALGSSQKERITLDVNQMISNDTAIRVNVMQDESSFSGREFQRWSRFGIAPSITFGLGTDTRYTLSYMHQSEESLPDYGIPWLYNAPAPVSPRGFYGFLNDKLKTGVDVFTAKVEKDLSENTFFQDQIRFGHYARTLRGISPRIATSTPLSADILTLNVNRTPQHRDSIETFFQNQANLVNKFKTGELEHTLVSSLEFGHESSSPTQLTFAVSTTNLLSPDSQSYFNQQPTARRVTRVQMDSLALSFMDTVKLNSNWQLLLGARKDILNTNFTEILPSPKTQSRLDEVTTIRTGLVYSPVQNGSVYVSYGTGFNPSAEALVMDSNESINRLAPEQSKSYELGTKWEAEDKSWNVRSAIFRSERINTREQDPNNAAFQTLSGSQSVSGFELETFAKLAEKWMMWMSYSYMDSRIDSSMFSPTLVGYPLGNVPKNMFNIWTNYQMTDRVQIGLGSIFVDTRQAATLDFINQPTGKPLQAPSYLIFNGMVSYKVDANWNLQLNVNNITNVTYYDQVYVRHIVPGESRNAVLTARFNF
jgi:catecholate siderophore receptor